MLYQAIIQKFKINQGCKLSIKYYIHPTRPKKTCCSNSTRCKEPLKLLRKLCTTIFNVTFTLRPVVALLRKDDLRDTRMMDSRASRHRSACHFHARCHVTYRWVKTATYYFEEKVIISSFLNKSLKKNRW